MADESQLSRLKQGVEVWNQADQAAIKELAQKISIPVINAQLAKDRFEIEF
jgi:GAF domain-containing protein